MKAIINGLVGGEHLVHGELYPSCLCLVHSNLSVLEQQISLLNLNGFSNDDIILVLGKNGIWQSECVKNKIAEINSVKIEYADKEMCFDLESIRNEDLIVIDGNFVMDISVVARILRCHSQNIVVTTKMLTPDIDCERMVMIDSNGNIARRSIENSTFPWREYTGICKISKELLTELKKIELEGNRLIDSLSNYVGEYSIKTIDYDDLISGKINGRYSNELVGGSYSKLNCQYVVTKEAKGEGREKLINEIEWLIEVPNELKSYFSEVLDYDIISERVYYNVPYYGKRNLREHIFAGYYDAEDTILFLDKLLQWMFKNVYSRKIGNAPKDWIIEKHINRVLGRLPVSSAKSEALSKLINAERIIINGKEYKNIKELYEIILHNKELIQRINPTDLVMIHGDLHFQNILLTNETDTGFILVDPRGEKLGSDIYYDIGKLLHSFHAKYDFIHSDQFILEMNLDKNIPVTNFEFTNTHMVKVYDDIYRKFLKLIQSFDYIKNDPDWKIKSFFAEASHLCSVMPFHVGKTDNPKRVVTLYLTGVILINEFFEEFMGDYGYSI